MDFYDEFKTYQEKTKTVGAEAVKESERQLTAAENALERVERIVVIDSIALPADIFFKSYKLPPPPGDCFFLSKSHLRSIRGRRAWRLSTKGATI